MKKLSILLIVAMLSLGMISCGNQEKEETVDVETDTKETVEVEEEPEVVEPSNAIIGKYNICEVVEGEETQDYSMLVANGMGGDYLEFSEDGKLKMILFGTDIPNEVDFDEMTITIQGEGSSDFEIMEDTITIKIAEGVEVTFVEENSEIWDALKRKVPNVDGVYDTGIISVVLPEGWNAFYEVVTSEKNNPTAILLGPTLPTPSENSKAGAPYLSIELIKGMPDDWTIEYNKQYSENVEGLESITSGNYTWDGYSYTLGEDLEASRLAKYGTKIGDYVVFVKAVPALGGGPLLCEDEAFTDIVNSLRVTGSDEFITQTLENLYEN